jgi:hypothetical protein
MVGNWTARNVTISGSGGSYAGGAGARWIIQANGSETIDWDGSGYFVLGGIDYYKYTGKETEHVRIGTGSSGRWAATGETDSRIAVYSPEIARATGKASEPVTDTQGVSATGTWSCSGNTMTIRVTVQGGSTAKFIRPYTIDVALAR